MVTLVCLNKAIQVLYPLPTLLICKQDYKKTTEQISMKLGWRMGLGPTIGPSKFSCRSGNTVHVMVGNTDGKHDHLKSHDSRLRTRSEEHVTHSDPTQAINKYHNP